MQIEDFCQFANNDNDNDVYNERLKSVRWKKNQYNILIVIQEIE